MKKLAMLTVMVLMVLAFSQCTKEDLFTGLEAPALVNGQDAAISKICPDGKKKADKKDGKEDEKKGDTEESKKLPKEDLEDLAEEVVPL